MAENTTYTEARIADDHGNGVAEGKVTYGADSITTTDYTEITCGFKPRFVKWVNATDRIAVTHFQGMADESCVKDAAAGTRTLEVTGGNKGITLTSDGFRVMQNATLGAIAASKVCYYIAIA